MSDSFLNKTGLGYLWGKIKALIPTKTSDLTNDGSGSGRFITATDIQSSFNNPTLKFGVGSNSDATANPHVELRKTGSGSAQKVSFTYTDSNGTTVANDIVSSSGEFIPDKVSKTGDTMTGALNISDSQIPLSTPSSDVYGQKGLQLLDSNGNRVTFLLGEFLSNGYRGLNLGTVRNVNGNDVYNSINLDIDGSGNPQVYVSGASAWRTALNAVSKAGDTMTGALNIKDNSITIGNVPSTTIASNVGVHIQDSAGTDIGFLKPLYRKTDQSAVDIGTTRIINNVAKYNTINLAIDNAGNREVAVSDAAAWRKALQLVGINMQYNSQFYDSTNGAVYLATPEDSNTKQAFFAFSNAGRIAWRTRTRTSTTASWGSYSAYTYLDTLLDAKASIDNSMSVSGVPCAGYLTSSGKQFVFLMPYPLFNGTSFTISSLSLVVRHINGGYVYVRSGTDGATYTSLGSGATAVITNGAAVRTNEVSDTKVWITQGVGVQIGITFKYTVCINNTGTTLANNTPLAFTATVTGTFS